VTNINIKEKILLGIIVAALFLTTSTVLGAKGGNTCTLANGNIVQRGFDEFGYNRCAHIFVGTGGSWCAQRGSGWDCSGESEYAPYANDKLVMKWNAEWDRGNAEDWSNPPYNAWLDNEWNGMVLGGSGEVWHYKIVWVGPELENSLCWREGGYPLWGQFEVIMSHGTYPEDGHQAHFWEALAIPNGYGI